MIQRLALCFSLMFITASPCLSVIEPESGICTFDTSVPGLPKALCQFASCLGGSDCLSPSITRENATIEIGQPWGRWSTNCPSPSRSPCWEAKFKIIFRLAATDPSGVKEIGVNLRHEQSGPSVFTKVWGKASSKDPNGRFVLSEDFNAFVNPGSRIEIGVFELCAKDNLDNEGCVLPYKNSEFQF